MSKYVKVLALSVLWTLLNLTTVSSQTSGNLTEVNVSTTAPEVTLQGNFSTKNNNSSPEPEPEKEDFTSFELCNLCSCPQSKTENPYVVDCRAIGLNFVPPFDHTLTDVDNVHLDLSFNHFDMVPPFEYNDFYDALEFNHNQIEIVTSNAFAELPHLKSLSLYENRIVTISKSAFCSHNDTSSSLEILDLRRNKLSKLEKDLFNCVHDLQQLFLASNDFNVIDEDTVAALNALGKLQVLDLSGNWISNIPTQLKTPIIHINTLNLANNRFNDVPDALQIASELIDLDLSGNPIKDLHAASFVGLQKLKNLHLNNMSSLTIIKAGAFQPLISLYYLECKFNPKLHTIEPLVFGDQVHQGSQYINSANFSHNNISNLSHQILNGTHIHIVDIRGNPINCTCDIYWLINPNFVYDTIQMLEETTCDAPESVRGRLLSEVGRDIQCTVQSCCSRSYSHVFFVVLLVVVIVLLLIAVYYFIKSRLPKMQMRYTDLHNFNLSTNSSSSSASENNFDSQFSPGAWEELGDISNSHHK